MSTPYELTGRIGQKRRTRAALVAAARDLVADGPDPHRRGGGGRRPASISRTTAYRYFPNQRALLAGRPPGDRGHVPAPARTRRTIAATRLDAVVERVHRTDRSTPRPQQRTMLRLSLEADPPRRARCRCGRAARSRGSTRRSSRCSDSSPTAIHRLVLAIRSAIGIEALAWLTDVAGLSRDDAAASYALVRARPAGRRARAAATKAQPLRPRWARPGDSCW